MYIFSFNFFEIYFSVFNIDAKYGIQHQRLKWMSRRVADERPVELAPGAEVPILDAEPDLGVGVAGALRLAVSKGYLEKEEMNKPSASRFAHLNAQNYSIEDKTHM